MQSKNIIDTFRSCACGCGAIISTPRKRTRYIMGHASKYKGGPRWIETDKGFSSPCWIWQLCMTTVGYGQVRINRRNMQAHRALYEQYVGSIPEGLELDHLCRIKSCVNPNHMEPVTHLENTRRGVRDTAHLRLLRKKKECLRGHLLTPENTYVYHGTRHCKSCGYIRKENRRSLIAAKRLSQEVLEFA